MPTSDRVGISSETLLEALHGNVDELESLFRLISYEKTNVIIPIPRISALPFKTGCLYLRLYDLKPQAYFAKGGGIVNKLVK